MRSRQRSVGRATPNNGMPEFWIAGDSIASQNGSFTQLALGSTQYTFSTYPYWWTQVLMKTGMLLKFEQGSGIGTGQRMGMNAGFGGDDMVNFAARLPTILAAMKLYGGTHLIISLGTNDNNSPVAYNTMASRMQAIAQTCLKAGIIPILTSILSRNAVDGSNDWTSSGGMTTAQKRLNAVQYNRAMFQYCRDNGIYWVDWTTNFSIQDTGQAKTGYTVDSLHPSATGSDSMSNDFIYTLNDILPKGRLAKSAYDSYDATYNPEGNIFNGLLTGAGGNSSAGSGTGTITAPGGGAVVVPDNFQIAKNTSTSTDLTFEVITDDDGYPALELEWTADGSGNSSEDWRLNSYISASTSYVGAVRDELYRIGAEMRIVENAAGVFKSFQPRVGQSSASAKTGTTISFDAVNGEIRDSSNGLGIFNPAGNRLVIVNNSTSNNGIYKYDSATAGVIKISPTKPVLNTSTGVVTETAQSLVNESAGANITLQNPINSVTYGSSSTLLPVFNNIYLPYVSPILEMPHTSNLVPRFSMYIDGTKTGTAKIQIRFPFFRKVLNKPSVLSVINSDD